MRQHRCPRSAVRRLCACAPAQGAHAFYATAPNASADNGGMIVRPFVVPALLGLMLIGCDEPPMMQRAAPEAPPVAASFEEPPPPPADDSAPPESETPEDPATPEPPSPAPVTEPKSVPPMPAPALSEPAPLTLDECHQAMQASQGRRVEVDDVCGCATDINGTVTTMVIVAINNGRGVCAVPLGARKIAR